MPSAEITAQFCDPQQPGKKNAAVKADDGQRYLVPPELFPQLQKGGRYKIDYEEHTYRNVNYRTIKKVEPIASAIAQHQKGKYGVSDDLIAERIFVSGILQRALAASASPFGVSEDMLVDEVNKLRNVWRRTFGNPQRDAELNDEIPF